MAYYSHYTVGSIYNNPLYTANKQGFSHCSRETSLFISPHSYLLEGLRQFRETQAAGVKWFILPRLSTLFHLLHVQRLPGVKRQEQNFTTNWANSDKP